MTDEDDAMRKVRRLGNQMSALVSTMLENIAKGEDVFCGYCGKQPRELNMVIDTSIGEVYCGGCHADLYGYRESQHGGTRAECINCGHPAEAAAPPTMPPAPEYCPACAEAERLGRDLTSDEVARLPHYDD